MDEFCPQGDVEGVKIEVKVSEQGGVWWLMSH